jgi:hypothetical protein
MKKLYSMTIAAGLALALAGCTGNNVSTPSGDKDGDGVANISDQCPNTLAGTKVSKDGCKIYTSILDLDVRKVCNVEANGIETVLATAKKYNTIAKKHGVEYRRLNVNNSALIASVDEALKSGAKMVNPVHFKSKPNKIKRSKTKLPVAYAAERSCKFAISALTQDVEAQTTWRDAVPGDGYKY